MIKTNWKRTADRICEASIKGMGFLFIFATLFILAVLSIFAKDQRLFFQQSIRKILSLSLLRQGISVLVRDPEKLLTNKKPYIFAACHQEKIDWIIIYSSLKGDVSALVDKFLLRPPYSIVTTKAGFLSFERHCSLRQSKELNQVRKFVANGGSLLIFMNTRIYKENQPNVIKPGVAYYSIASKVPVIPVKVKKHAPESGTAIYELTFGPILSPPDATDSHHQEFHKKIVSEVLDFK